MGQRTVDIDRVEAILDERDLRCLAVAETHIHNDYVTGGYELARRTGADYVVSDKDPVAFDRRPVSDGDEMTFGSMRVRPIATPGHTVTHLSYFIEDVEGDDPAAVFTGGSLLYGSVGRTDLVAEARTEELTRAQFHSARRLAELPADARVYPTHGFGSFCSSGSAAGGESSTIGVERERNDALTTPDEDSFVETLIANLTAYPAYYAHMGARNLEGPGAVDLSLPQLLDAQRLRPWGTPLTLIGETADQIRAAQRQLVRIGIDRPDAAALGSPAELGASTDDLDRYPVATFEELAAADRSQLTVLDTRREDERAQGGIDGSVHIPLHGLLSRLGEVPQGPVWVHCASGYRASIAASLLARAGRDVTLVDDEYAKAADLGLT